MKICKFVLFVLFVLLQNAKIPITLHKKILCIFSKKKITEKKTQCTASNGSLPYKREIDSDDSLNVQYINSNLVKLNTPKLNAQKKIKIKTKSSIEKRWLQ